MSAFESKWADWQPKEPTPLTDKTDKRASVSFVSSSHRHILPAEGPFVSFVSASPGHISRLEGEEISPEGRRALTDKTDKRCSPGGHATLLQAPDGVPTDWAQGTADLLAMPPPSRWPESGWRTLQEDTLVFIRDWAAQAHALGWGVLDLFGVHAAAPRARLDGMGLVPLLDGRPVVAITEDNAAINARSGGALTYRKKRTWPPGCCLVWDLRVRS